MQILQVVARLDVPIVASTFDPTRCRCLRPLSSKPQHHHVARATQSAFVPTRVCATFVAERGFNVSHGEGVLLELELTTVMHCA